MKRSCEEDRYTLNLSMRRCAIENFREMHLIDVEMAKEEIDRFEKGLEQRVRQMENDDSVLLIRNKGHEVSALMREVYMWYQRDNEEALRKCDIVDIGESRKYSEEHTLVCREISSIVHPTRR